MFNFPAGRPVRFKLGWHTIQAVIIALAIPALGLTLMGAMLENDCYGRPQTLYPERVVLGISHDSPSRGLTLSGVNPYVDLTLYFSYYKREATFTSIQEAEAKNITWTLDNPALGELTDLQHPDRNSRRFTPKSEGTVTITVTGTVGSRAGDVPFAQSVQVTTTNFTSTAKSVAISPSTSTLFVPGPDVAKQLNPTSVQLSATVTLLSGSVNGQVNWSSSNTGVATVSSNGLVTAKGEGSATITATSTDGKASSTATITVRTGGNASIGVQ